MLSTLAGMWRDEIIEDRRREGSPPGTIESEEIYKSCSNRILAGIESGNLEATYPENRLFKSSTYNRETHENITEDIKLAPWWIIETPKYITWAKANGAGPKVLIEEADTDQQKNNVKILETEHNNPNESNQLIALNSASLKFWRNADQSDKGTWPKTQDIIDFLIAHGFSKTLAIKGASIARPEWAESGRIPSE